MTTTATHDTVVSESCTLHYWYQGAGPLLIFVPGGNGHARQYYAIMEILKDQYTVATFDRRQMSASVSTSPGIWNPVQHARDIISVMRALGHSTTSVFASSGGGVIALQLAVSYPSVLEHVVIHEAPTSSLLPAEESTEFMDHVFELQDIFRKGGVKAAMPEFSKRIMVGMDDGIPTLHPEPENQLNQFENESPWMGLYCPDLQRIKDNGTSITVGYGAKSKNEKGWAVYVRTTVVQAERLGCERVQFPGHHQGFETEPGAFAPVLRDVLIRAGVGKADG